MNMYPTLEKLATSRSNPSITISLNTHRTHPDNLKDEIELKNLLKEAEQKLDEEYQSSDTKNIKEKLSDIVSKIDFNHLNDSLHIFVSEETEEVIKSIWPVKQNTVTIDDHFAIRPIIMYVNRSREYLILKLAQGGTHLYRAMNEDVTEEIINHVFPFAENPHYAPTNIQRSDAEYMDDLVREHYRDIDKAVVDFVKSQDEELKVVVVTTEDNYSKLTQVATRPEIYLGFSDISHNEKSPHHLAVQSWDTVKKHQENKRKELLQDGRNAVSEGKLLTDLQEIFQASLDGRGEMLIVHQDFKQPVKMVDSRTFTYVDDPKEQGFINDITNQIAWNVINNGGRVIFKESDEMRDLGEIALKTRY